MELHGRTFQETKWILPNGQHVEFITSCEANDSWPKIRSGLSMDEKVIIDINNAMDSNVYFMSENANQCNTQLSMCLMWKY